MPKTHRPLYLIDSLNLSPKVMSVTFDIRSIIAPFIFPQSCKSIANAKKRLDMKLLRRHEKTGLLKVNFDPALVSRVELESTILIK